MKTVIISLSLILLSSCKLSNNEKRVFKVEEKANELFKIMFAYDNHPLNNSSYPLSSVGGKKLDTLDMISELLTYEGDIRKCIVPAKVYSSTISYFFTKKITYSIEIEALFIINQLYFDDDFFYSACPLLFNKKGIIISTEELKQVYHSYRLFFNSIEKDTKWKENKKDPLENSEYYWGCH